MRKGGGKDKGAGYERECARVLSIWVSEGKSKDLFWRSAASGAMATMRAKQGKDVGPHAGDLIPVGQEGSGFMDAFCVECKRVKSMNWVDLIYNRLDVIDSMPPIDQFWNQAVSQGGDSNRRPFLMFREDRKPDLIGIDAYMYDYLQVKMGNIFSAFTIDDLVLVVRDELFNLPAKFLCKASSEAPGRVA